MYLLKPFRLDEKQTDIYGWYNLETIATDQWDEDGSLRIKEFMNHIGFVNQINILIT